MRISFLLIIFLTIISCNKHDHKKEEMYDPKKISEFFLKEYGAKMIDDTIIDSMRSIDKRKMIYDIRWIYNIAFPNDPRTIVYSNGEFKNYISHNNTEALIIVEIPEGLKTEIDLNDCFTIAKVNCFDVYPEGYNGNENIKYLIKGNLIGFLSFSEVKRISQNQ